MFFLFFLLINNVFLILRTLVRISSAKIIKETNLTAFFIIIYVHARDFFHHVPTTEDINLKICNVQLSDSM